MSTSNQTFRGSIRAGTNPKITHEALTAGTEKPHTLTGIVRKILIQNRGTGNVRLSWVENGTGAGTNQYVDIPAYASRAIDGIEYSGTIYLRSSADQTVFVEQWQ